MSHLLFGWHLVQLVAIARQACLPRSLNRIASYERPAVAVAE
jgi:hypothetical protein